MKEDNIKFDSKECRLYGATKKDIRRWKAQWPYLDYDDTEKLLRAASWSIQLRYIETLPGHGLLAWSKVNSALRRKVHDEIGRNPRKALEDWLETENFLISSILSETQKERLSSKPTIPIGAESKTKRQKRDELERNENKFSGETLALAMLVEHPEWTDKKIAEAVGVNRTTLYDWPNFKKAKEALKQGKKKFPRGSKNSKTGDMEAWQADI